MLPNSLRHCLMMATVLFSALSLPVIAEQQDEPSTHFEWMASEASQTPIYMSVHDGRPDIEDIYGTRIPKLTADAEAFTKRYVLELERFGIHNDATHPAETSRGINLALAHAKTIHANYIIFPKGEYLISENDPIILDHQDTIVDLNEATLRINPNGLQRYSIVTIMAPARNFRLTNGRIVGDRDTHDYTTNKGPHEHGMGLTLAGGVQLEVDNLTITHLPGSGVSTRIYIGKGTRQFKWMRASDLKPGILAEDGSIVASVEQLVTTDMIDISSAIHGFEFGYTLGYQSYQSIRGRSYLTAFYDKDGQFLKTQPSLQFRKEAIPEHAKFIRLQFNQADAKNASEGVVGRVTDLDFPADVHFHHNTLTNNRTLGLAFCGGQKWIIEHNHFSHNGGNSPGFGVDFEDGWDLMREVVFRNNTFAENKAGDLVVCAGTEMRFIDNDFVSNVIFYDRANNYEFARNTVTGGRVLFKTGIKHAVIHHNTYNKVNLQIQWNQNNWPDVPPLRLKHETIDSPTYLGGRHLVFEHSTLRNIKLNHSASTSLLALRECDLEDVHVTQTHATRQPLVMIESSRITQTKGPLLQADVRGMGKVQLIGNQIRSEARTPLIVLRSKNEAATMPTLIMQKNHIDQMADHPIIGGDAAVNGTIEMKLADNVSNRPMTASP